MARQKKTHDPFRWFGSSPEVIRLVVMMYVRYPLSLRNVEDLLKFVKKAMKRHGRPRAVVTDCLRSYGAALKAIAVPS